LNILKRKEQLEKETNKFYNFLASSIDNLEEIDDFLIDD